MKKFPVHFVSLMLGLSALGSRLSAQPVRQVSLEDAIRLADRTSESVEIARAAVTRANGQQMLARSLFLPQVNGSLSYGKTLKSQFEALASSGPDTATFRSLCSPRIDPTATAGERTIALNQALTCQGGGGIDFSKVGFGAKNSWTFGLQFSQNVFTGGRATGQRIASSAGRRAADVELTAQRAQLILDITQAYYNAVLASRLADIAHASMGWNEDVLRQTTKAREVGSSSEFDLLRAQVSRDNYVPIVLQRKSDRNVALLRLKQLLEMPLDDSLQLTTDIDVAPMATMVGMVAAGAKPDTSADARATVREAAENVRAQEGLLRAARGDRLPSVAVTSGYQRLFFPTTTFPQFGDFAENWTLGVTIGTSLFSGGRTAGNFMMADASLREARARHKQAREFAALDSRIALSQLEQAEAAWRASQGTAEQARKAYGIDEIRYREGISTQTDLTSSRLLVEQAMVNRAVAARDYAVARMRMALLKDLPLNGSGTSGATAGTASAPAAPPAQTRSTTSGASAGSSGSNQ
ncbi:MAG: TolC family protein [Gemmatimonadota bacterium]